MAYEVIMPKAGMAMETGTILKWLKKVGDEVVTGEPLLEIETDKVAMEVESETTGVLLRIVHHEGEEVPVTETIAFIGQPGEEISAEAVRAGRSKTGDSDAHSGTAGTGTKPAVRPEASSGRVGRVAATPLARTLAAEQGVDLSTATPTGPYGEVKARDVLSIAAAGGVKASPLARRIAELQGIDLEVLEGSGRSGKILKRDVIGAQASKGSTSGARTPMGVVRKRIARRMSESHASIPPVTLNAEADVTSLVALRRDLEDQTGNRYSLNDFILRAAVIALKLHPTLMQQLDGEELLQPESVNIGIAVSVDDTLLVPVVRDADALSFGELANQAHSLAEKTRGRGLTPDDLSGATFTVTNLGMFGITDFTPIVNPPESAILGVGTVRESLHLVDERVESRKKMTLSLTIDHRIIDGAAGARFLSDLRDALERPLRLLE